VWRNLSDTPGTQLGACCAESTRATRTAMCGEAAACIGGWPGGGGGGFRRGNVLTYTICSSSREVRCGQIGRGSVRWGGEEVVFFRRAELVCGKSHVPCVILLGRREFREGLEMSQRVLESRFCWWYVVWWVAFRALMRLLSRIRSFIYYVCSMYTMYVCCMHACTEVMYVRMYCMYVCIAACSTTEYGVLMLCFACLCVCVGIPENWLQNSK
jgi:hypothetical protein